MTPIYGRPTWHDPRATPVPSREKSAEKWHGRHDPRHDPVPPFGAFYRVNQANGTAGTTARLFAVETGDVGKSPKKGHYLHIYYPVCKSVVPAVPPKNPRPYMGVLGGQ